MQTELLNLPTNVGLVPATLHYEYEYASGKKTLDFLHLIRQKLLFTVPPDGDALEEQYWDALNAFRHRFANDCLQAIGPIDLLIDPASNTGYHRPFVSAFKQAYPSVYWLRFIKTANVTSDINNLDPLRNAVTLGADRTRGKYRKVAPSSTRSILIADDVFSTGGTVAVIVEKLFAMGIARDVAIHVAAPLRVRVPPQGNQDDVVTDADLPKQGFEELDEDDDSIATEVCRS